MFVDASAMSEDTVSALASIQKSLQRMAEKLSGVTADVEDLKKVGKPPEERGLVHSTPVTQSVSQPGNSEDTITMRIMWSERMDLESEDEHNDHSVNSEASQTAEPVCFDKIRITPVLETTEEFLKSAFCPMENGPRRQLRHQFIVPGTPFTTPPHLDKFIVGECSKSTKSNDNLFSDIQAHFLDAVGPLTGILESINSGTELAIEEVESAVKATLTFLGNASSRSTSIRRQGVLQDYNKDLMSFASESDELFGSATKTLLGPAFPEKASAHLRQMQTLRNSKISNVAPKSKQQGFQRAPSQYSRRGGKSYSLQRRHQPYSRGGKGKGVSQKPSR